MGQAVRRRYRVRGMTCPACQAAVERAALRLPQVRTAQASVAQGVLEVTYASGAEARASEGALAEAVQASGYEMVARPARAGGGRGVLASLLTLAAIAGALALAHALGLTDVFLAFPTVGSDATYPALFAAGLLTSLHCIAMCGGLNLSQSLVGEPAAAPASDAGASISHVTPRSRPGRARAALRALRPSALYNLGRLTSYTAIGGALGLLGSTFALSAATRAVVSVAAGAFMAAMGLTLMGVLRPGALARLLPRGFASKIASATTSLRRRGPFLLGVANGFMPCGPLQAMQVYAVATGSMLAGALSLFCFCLGTVPLMFFAGSVISALKARVRRTLMRVGGALIVVFGLASAGNGLALLGVEGMPAVSTGQASSAAVATVGADGVQRATVEVDYGSYQDVRLLAGVPTELTFHVPQGRLIGCNSSLTIPAAGVTADLAEGDTTVALAPLETGTYPYSCWMGMIKASITVTEG